MRPVESLNAISVEVPTAYVVMIRLFVAVNAPVGQLADSITCEGDPLGPPENLGKHYRRSRPEGFEVFTS